MGLVAMQCCDIKVAFALQELRACLYTHTQFGPAATHAFAVVRALPGYVPSTRTRSTAKFVNPSEHKRSKQDEQEIFQRGSLNQAGIGIRTCAD